MPFRARGFQLVVAARDGALAGAPGGELHDERRQGENGQKHQVHQHERRAAVLAGDVGETPHVAQTDGATGAYQNEAQAASELFAFHSPSKPRDERYAQKAPGVLAKRRARTINPCSVAETRESC